MSNYITSSTLALPRSNTNRGVLIIALLSVIMSACSDLPSDPLRPGVSDAEEAGAVAGGAESAGDTADNGATADSPQDGDEEAASGTTSAGNPFQGTRLYRDPSSNAARQAAEWRTTRPPDAAEMDRIAMQPQAIWMGDWNPQPYELVVETTRRVSEAGALPVYVLYNIPKRDCGLHSSGGASGAAAYRTWIAEVARGIGDEAAAIVLEPDALAGLDCLSASEQSERTGLLREAVRILKASGRVSVYVDAGNARWHPPVGIAARLEKAGIAEADGFALNVSNFLADDETIHYGDLVSALVGNKHYVIDTSRNGRGPAADLSWCNPSGRGLGARPTTNTGHARVDAFLWIKAPGESDGSCNGGPAAGVWWPEYALELARNSA